MKPAVLKSDCFAAICLSARAAEIIERRSWKRQGSYDIGSCRLVVNEGCPNPDINFYLHTRNESGVQIRLEIEDSTVKSNLLQIGFDPETPTKIIIHGYNSDMFLGALVEIKKQYLINGEYNIIAVDWQRLANGPCYPTAVFNTRHVGRCTAQIVEVLRDLAAVDIHVIGFSLGAHVTNYVATHLRPYKLPRITGLDPALPGFILASKDNKLDAGDAEFVDVIHTNAFVQGKVELSGHVDFFMNGGVSQPGCWAENRFFACNHHRAPIYFAESINSKIGFYGWPCRNYFFYLIGLCPPRNPQILMGDKVSTDSQGMHLAITGSVSPFAVGKFVGPEIEIIKEMHEQQRQQMIKKINLYKREILQQCCDFEDYITGDLVNYMDF